MGGTVRLLIFVTLFGTPLVAESWRMDSIKIHQAARDSTGRVWGAGWYENGGLFCWDGNQWKLASGEGTAVPPPFSLVRGPDGAIYGLSAVTTAVYVVTWHKGSVSKVLARFEAQLYEPSLFVDRSRNIWITESGRHIFRVTADGKADCVYSITDDQFYGSGNTDRGEASSMRATTDGRGRIWFWPYSWAGNWYRTLQGVLIFDGRRFEHHPQIVGAPDTKISVVAPQDGKHMWLGTADGRLYSVDIDTLKTTEVQTPFGSPAAGVEGIFAAGGRTYVVAGPRWGPVPDESGEGRMDSLWQLSGDKWTLLVAGLDRWRAPFDLTPRPYLLTRRGLWVGAFGAGPWFIPSQGAKAVLVDWRYGNPVAGSESLLELSDGRILISGQFSGSIAARPSDLLAAHHPTPQVQTLPYYAPLIRDARGHILGMLSPNTKVLSDWDGNAWTQHTLPESFTPFNYLWSFDEDTRKRIWLLPSSCGAPVAIFDPVHGSAEAFPDYLRALGAQLSRDVSVPFEGTLSECTAPSVAPDGRFAFGSGQGEVRYFDGNKLMIWTRKQIDGDPYGGFLEPPFFNRAGNLAVNIQGVTWEWTKGEGWLRGEHEPGLTTSAENTSLLAAPAPSGCGFERPDSMVRDQLGTYWMTYQGQIYRAIAGKCVAQISPEEHHPFGDSRKLTQVLIDLQGNAFLRTRFNLYFHAEEYVVVKARSPVPRTSIRGEVDESAAVKLSLDSRPEGQAQFIWRIDGGPWSDPTADKGITLEWLPEGKHQIEAMAIDARAQVDPTPPVAEVEIHVDPKKQLTRLIAQLSDPDATVRNRTVKSLRLDPTFGLPLLRSARQKAGPEQRPWIDAAFEKLGQPIPPGPLQLSLQWGDGRTSFHLGEIIPVELTFTSTERHKYPITHYGPQDCGTHVFHIEPPAFIDRRVEMDAAMEMPGFGSLGIIGPAPQFDPGEKPYLVELTLNERFRIVTPGKYTIFVTSQLPGFPVRSNSVKLEILPSDAAWERSELARGVALLSTPRGSQTHEQGCSIIRYLETEAGEREMAKRYNGGAECGSFRSGLINAGHRGPVLEEMEADLADPTHAVAGELRVMAFVSVYLKHPDWYPQPPKNLPEIGPAAYEPWQESGLWKHFGALKEEELRFARELVKALPQKEPEARARSLATLAAYSGTPDLAEVVRKELPVVFLKLPPQFDQTYLLKNQWPVIESPAMVPVLRAILEDQSGMEPAGIALRRLYEISPAEARPYFLRELNAQNPRVGIDVLRLLPDQELPELDDKFLERVKQSLPYDGAPLIAATAAVQRYASWKIADALRPLLPPMFRTASCQAEANLLSYFLRVDLSQGDELLRQAVQASNAAKCQTLSLVADLHMSNAVESAALAALDDPDPHVVANALSVLRLHSSPDTKKPILQHFHQWHAQWSPRAAELERPEGAAQQGMDDAYLRTLGAAQGWLSSPAEVRELSELCVTKVCKDDADRTANSAQSDMLMIRVWNPDSGDLPRKFSIAQYPAVAGLDRLEQKLAQYPQGTVFVLYSIYLDHQVAQSVFDELKPWIKQHGYDLNTFGQ